VLVVVSVVVGLVDVVVSSVVVVLVCANANGAASPQTKAIIVFFILYLGLPPQFVTRGSNGRSLSVLSLHPPSSVVIREIRDFGDLSGRHEFSNIERQ
jgi:hypothetical protein